MSPDIRGPKASVLILALPCGVGHARASVFSSGQWGVGLDTHRGLYSLKGLGCVLPRSPNHLVQWIPEVRMQSASMLPKQTVPVLWASSHRSQFHPPSSSPLTSPALEAPSPTSPQVQALGWEQARSSLLPFPPLHPVKPCQ